MRPPSLARINLRTSSNIVCLRAGRQPQQQRHLSERQKDQKAELLFNEKATLRSVADLLKNPQRDVYSYDKKQPVFLSSPAISALHARIGLPTSFPLETLRRCLTDPSTQPDHTLHNEALSIIGSGLLEYYVSEYLCVRWPRLPMKVQLAAVWAYTGESALARIAREWGVRSETVSKPKITEDSEKIDSEPTLLVKPPTKQADQLDHELGINMEWEIREQAKQGWLEPRGRQGTKGFINTRSDEEYVKRFVLFALQRFVQSLVGGVYLNSDINVTQGFIKAHILSRTLPPLSTLHIVNEPARELTRLCDRLEIPLPTSRLIAESGRHSHSPVFVVGVYSGREKLGEGQGTSLKEAKFRANTNALRAWYLYEQAGWEFALPSRAEDPEKTYVTGYIDPGSIVL